MLLTQWSPGESQKKVVRTHGYWIEYSNGQRHLDMLAGNSAFVLGYNDTDILQAMHENPVNYLRGTSGDSCESNDELIKLVCDAGHWSGLCWAVSGSDAVEAAVAMNDSYWTWQNEHRFKILSLTPGYHGATMLAKHLQGAYTYLDRAVTVPGPQWTHVQQQAEAEAQALCRIQQALQDHKDIGCVLFETVPWIGRLTPYSSNWWHSLRQLCDQYGVLMINDDVAFCWGKLGHLFGYQAHGVQPDIVAIGKALTAGYSPLGAAVCNQRVHDILQTRSWTHGHTWSPNMWGVSAALAATKKIQRLMPQADQIQQRLQSIGNKLNLTHRGQGLAICYDFAHDISWADQSQVGLANNIEEHHAVKVFAPLIADDEYFEHLELGLTILVDKFGGS